MKIDFIFKSKINPKYAFLKISTGFDGINTINPRITQPSNPKAKNIPY